MVTRHRATVALAGIALLVAATAALEFAQLPHAPDGFREVEIGAGRDSFFVVQLTDLHVGFGQQSDSNLQAVVESVNARVAAGQPIKLVMVTGDVSNTGDTTLPDGQLAWAASVLGTLSVPWVPLIGNHDMVDVYADSSGWHEADTVGDPPESLFVTRGFNAVPAIDSEYRRLAESAGVGSFPISSFERYTERPWNFEPAGWGDVDFRDVWQTFAFKVGPAGSKYRFLCLDCNTRRHAENGQLGMYPSAGLHGLVFNDRARTAWIEPKDPDDYAVSCTLYADAGFQGTRVALAGRGWTDITQSAIGNGLSAVKLLGNCDSVVLFDQDGTRMVLKQSDPDLEVNGPLAWWLDYLDNYIAQRPADERDKVIVFAHNTPDVGSIVSLFGMIPVCLPIDEVTGFDGDLDHLTQLMWARRDVVGAWFGGHVTPGLSTCVWGSCTLAEASCPFARQWAGGLFPTTICWRYLTHPNGAGDAHSGGAWTLIKLRYDAQPDFIPVVDLDGSGIEPTPADLTTDSTVLVTCVSSEVQGTVPLSAGIRRGLVTHRRLLTDTTVSHDNVLTTPWDGKDSLGRLLLPDDRYSVRYTSGMIPEGSVPFAAAGYCADGPRHGMWGAGLDPVVLTGDVTVPDGETLVIQPGVRVMPAGNYGITVHGTLIAPGLPGDTGRILFTPYRRMVPVPESVPDSMYWKGIKVMPGGRCSLNNVVIEYAGASTGADSAAIVWQDAGSLSLTNSVIRHSASRGLWTSQGDIYDIPVCVRGDTFEDCAGYPVIAVPESVAAIAATCTFRDNGTKAFDVRSTGSSPFDLHHTGYWPACETTGWRYDVTGSLRVSPESTGTCTLRLGPKVTMRFSRVSQLQIGDYQKAGFLQADGSVGPIAFTGMDTTAPYNYWGGIHVANGSGAFMDSCDVAWSRDDNIEALPNSGLTLRFCTMRHADAAGVWLRNTSPTLYACTFSNGAYGVDVEQNTAQPLIQNCLFSGNSVYGLRAGTSAPVSVTGCTFSSNSRPARLRANLVSDFVANNTFSGNTFKGLDIWSGSGSSAIASGTHHWTASPELYIYRCSSIVYVEAAEDGKGKDGLGTAKPMLGNAGGKPTSFTAPVLEISPGAVVELDGQSKLYVSDGLLRARGRADSVITFRCWQSGHYWGGIELRNGSDSSELTYCVLDSGGYNDDRGAVYCSSSDPTFRRCVFRNASRTAESRGIGVYQARPTVRRCLFSHCSRGIDARVGSGSALAVDSCRFDTCGSAMRVSYGPPIQTAHSDFVDNTVAALDDDGANDPGTASSCYWSNATDPHGPHGGDTVYNATANSPYDTVPHPFFPALDVAVTQPVTPGHRFYSDTAVRFAPSGTLHNYFDDTVVCAARMQIGTGYDRTMSTTLAGLSSRSDTFPSCTLAVGVHVRRFTCLVNGDQNRHNDTIIDTIVVRPYTDAAALAVLSPTGWVWVGDTVHPQARVANLGATAQSVPVRFLLDSTLVQTETVSLVPYETTAVDFSALTPAAGLRTVRFVTALAFDDSVHNDTVADTVRVRGPDVAALAVLAPVDTVTFEDAVVPSVRVANLCGAAVGLPVRFRLDGVTVESESVSLAPHETTVVEFSARLLAAGTRAVEFVAALGGDDYHLNDTVRDSVRVLGGDYWRELAAPGIDSARLCWDRGEYVYAADRNSATMTRYAIAADTWETIAAPPITRVRGLTAHHGVVYVLGQPLTDAPTQLCRYVAEADTWVAEQVAVQLTSTADDAALVSDQGPSIYVITGSPLDAAGDVVRYFPDEDTVIDIDGPGFSHQGAADWSGSSLYAVQRNNTLKRYDSLTETWTTVANPQGGSGWVYGPTMACDPVLDRLYAFVPGIGFGLPGKEKSGKAGGTDQSYSFWERQNDGSAWVLRAIPPALDTGAGMCFGPVQAYLLDGAGGFWRYRPLPVQDVAATLAFAPDTVPAESAFSVAGVVRNSDSAQRTVPVELVVGTYCDTANVGMAGRACDTLQFTGVQPSEHGFLTARLRVMPGFSDARPANDTAWASVYRRHQLDVSADSIAVPTDSWPFDSIVQPAAWVQNRSDETLSVQVRCWIDSAYADSCVLWLPPLSTARADSFDTCHLRVGLHVVQFAVSCAGDVEPDNDSIFDTIEVVTCGYWREVQNSPCESPIRLAGDGPLVYAMPDSGTGFYCYDPEKDDWEELTSSPLVRTWSVAARDGFVYALGTPRSACDRSAPTSSRTRDQAEDVIAEYEVAGDRWRTLADRLPSTPGPGSCVFIDKAGLLYLLADGDSGNFFCTDTAVEEWQARASLPAGQKLPSYTSGACDAAGDCYAVSDIAGVLFRYDSKNDTWLALDSVVGWVGVMPDPPDASALAPGGNGKPYLYWPAEEPPGGTGFYEFDLGNDVWTAKPAFPALVPEPALAGAGSELYLSLGDGSRTFARFRLEPGLDVAATEVIVPDTVGYDSAILVSGVVQNCCAVPAWYYAQLEVPGDSTQTSGLRYVEPWQYDTVAFDACTLPPGEQELVLTAVCAGDVNHENDQQTKLVYVLGPWRPLEDVFAQGRLDADGEGSVFASDRHTSSVSQYSIAAGEWTDLAAPPLDSGIIDLSYDDGQLYVLGPVCADSRTGKPRGRQRDGDATGWAIYRWDLQDAEWKLVTDTMPEDEPTVNSWIVARDSSVYYGPGYGGHFFRHDDQGGWTKLAQVPDSILPPCAVDWDRDNDIIYLMALTSDTSVFYAYSIDRDSWSALPALPSSVYGDGLGLAVEPDGHVAALVHGDETSAGFYEWKQEADGWYLLPSAPWALADGAALTCLGAQAYALTGDDAVQPSTFWCYDPGLNDRPGQRTDGAAGGRVTPRIFYLYEPVPTPFAARTLIRWQVPVATHVVLRVHDAVGRLVRTLVDAEVQPGCYSSVWDGADAAGRRVRAGVYFCALEAAGRRYCRKVVLIVE